jgi:hypothetical protein
MEYESVPLTNGPGRPKNLRIRTTSVADVMTTNFFHPSLLLMFLDPGWVKIRIRDKHPGSATLRTTDIFFTNLAVQVKVERDLLVVVTTGGRLYLWDLSGGHQPKALLKNEEICPLNRCQKLLLIYYRVRTIN